MGSPLFLGFLNKQWLPPCFEAFILNSLLLCLCSNFVALSLWKFFLLINWTWLGLCPCDFAFVSPFSRRLGLKPSSLTLL